MSIRTRILIIVGLVALSVFYLVPRRITVRERDPVTGVMTDPARVEVTGPARRVDVVDSATTDPVDATGLLSQHTFTTSAYVSDPHVQVVNPQPVRVTVFVGKSSGGSD